MYCFSGEDTKDDFKNPAAAAECVRLGSCGKKFRCFGQFRIISEKALMVLPSTWCTKYLALARGWTLGCSYAQTLGRTDARSDAQTLRWPDARTPRRSEVENKAESRISGEADPPRKILREKNLAGRSPARFFSSPSVVQVRRSSRYDGRKIGFSEIRCAKYWKTPLMLQSLLHSVYSMPLLRAKM